MIHRLRAFLTVLAVLTIASGHVNARTLNIGMAIPSYAHSVLWIAKDGGFFKKNGLDVKVYVLKGSADSVRLLLSGDMDIVLAGGDAVVKADLAGGDLVAFAGLVNTFYHNLVALGAVQTPADLKGRSIGLPFLGGPQDIMVRMVLKRYGLTPEKDVAIRNMGAEYTRLAAVTQGRVDAVTSDAPPSVLKGLGLHVVADVPSWNIPFPYMAAVARRSFLDKEEDTALRFLKALSEAMVFYRDNEKKSLAILERGTQANSAESYRFSGPSRFTYPPHVDPAGFKTILEFLEDPAAVKRRPEDFVDRRLTERLEREGFFGR